MVKNKMIKAGFGLAALGTGTSILSGGNPASAGSALIVTGATMGLADKAMSKKWK